MKLLATGSLKFAKLKRRLGLAHWQTVGVLESLWLFVQHNCPEGDIGRYSNEDIAAGIEWDSDPDQLVESLRETGWLDESEEYRLLVHDWQDHCPNYLKGNFAKHGKTFAKQLAKQLARDGAKQPARDGASDGSTLSGLGEAGLGKPKESRKRHAFVPPTEAEVGDYCRERANGVDPVQFVAFYRSKGWRIGKEPMKDWRAAVVTWEQRRKTDTEASTPSYTKPMSPPRV